MKIKEASVFAKNIKSKNPPGPASNVVFEDGIFNTDILYNGFNWLDNRYIPYPQAGFYGGNMAIRGGGAAGHFDTGEVLIAVGSNYVEASISNDQLRYTGNTNDQELSGISYYLPLSMQSLQIEGYSKLKIAAGNSAYGIPGASSTFDGVLIVSVLRSSGPSALSVLNSITISEEGLYQEPEVLTYEINLSSYQEYVPTFVSLEFVVGTSHITKIWFE